MHIGSAAAQRIDFVKEKNARPMPSGLPNREKQRVRQLYAEGMLQPSPPAITSDSLVIM